MPTEKGPERRPPGPDPERLKVEGDWEEAVRKALSKPPPPKEKTPKTRRRKK
jgi:hypothetical protein